VIRTIVEGEPGIFPEPVARLMRGIGGLFRRKPQPADTPPTNPSAADAASTEPPSSDGRTGQSGDST
jgi:hypothetical protein